VTLINGMPAHVLLVHALVVLAPLTAVLEILCALWPTVRRGHMLWLTVVLASVVAVLTPITAEAGEWLYDQAPEHAPALEVHAELGDTMVYVALALAVVALALVALWFAERRDSRRTLLRVVVAVVAVLVGIGAVIQVYRIGDAGARAVWGSETTASGQGSSSAGGGSTDGAASSFTSSSAPGRVSGMTV